MSTFEQLHPRNPDGTFTEKAHSESVTTLPANSRYINGQVEARSEALFRGDQVAPTTLTGKDAAYMGKDIARWWESQFLTAEYRNDDKSVAQMPDDYTPNMTHGRAMSGHRRTHRYWYANDSGDMRVRMPSKTSVRAFVDGQNGRKVDVPVQLELNDKTVVTGWVRVSPGAGGTWYAEPLGFPNKTHAAAAAEMVAATLENRRSTVAAMNKGKALRAHKKRQAAWGASTAKAKTNSFIKGFGYNHHEGVGHVQIGDRLYGYKVPVSVFENLAATRRPGTAYNELIKGQKRAPVSRCAMCGRVYNSRQRHDCPAVHNSQTGTIGEHEQRARWFGGLMSRTRARYKARQNGTTNKR